MTKLDEGDTYLEAAKKFDIRDCVETVVEAWSQVTSDTVKNGWNKLLRSADANEEPNLTEQTAELLSLRNANNLYDFDVLNELNSSFPDEVIFGTDNTGDISEGQESESETFEDPCSAQVDSIIQNIESLVLQVTKDDPHPYRSKCFTRGLKGLAEPYKLLQQKLNLQKVQPKLSHFWKKVPATKRQHSSLASSKNGNPWVESPEEKERPVPKIPKISLELDLGEEPSASTVQKLESNCNFTRVQIKKNQITAPTPKAS